MKRKKDRKAKTGRLKKAAEKELRKASVRENVLFEERYRGLYGAGDHSAVWERQRRRYRTVTVSFLILAVVLLGASLYQQFRTTPGLVYDGDRIIAVTRPGEGEGALTLDTKVYALTEEGPVSREKVLTIHASGETAPEAGSAIGEETEEDVLLRRMDQAARQVNTTYGKDVVYLPTELEDGTPLVWQEIRRVHWPMILLILSGIGFLLYRSRFYEIKALEKEARMSIIRELPDFMQKVLLLTEAGVVLEVAFERAADGLTKDTYFADQIRGIRRRSKETRVPMTEGFREFAQRTDVLELTRLSGILADNVDKGADLTEKLRTELGVLWFRRKQQTEEQGRLAETKMTLPLVILLMVLLLVTCAPALLEMNG